MELASTASRIVSAPDTDAQRLLRLRDSAHSIYLASLRAARVCPGTFLCRGSWEHPGVSRPDSATQTGRRPSPSDLSPLQRNGMFVKTGLNNAPASPRQEATRDLSIGKEDTSAANKRCGCIDCVKNLKPDERGSPGVALEWPISSVDGPRLGLDPEPGSEDPSSLR